MIRFCAGPLGESPVPMVIGYFGGKWYKGNMDSVSGNNMSTKTHFVLLCNDLPMHSFAAVNRHRITETEPTWFVFETSCYAFSGGIRLFASQK